MSFRDEAEGFLGCFRFRPGNSDAEKWAMFVALGLFAAMTVAVVFFNLELNAQGQGLWALLLATFSALLGRNWKDETRHVRRKRKGKPPEED